jgi:hypothetical protein
MEIFPGVLFQMITIHQVWQDVLNNITNVKHLVQRALNAWSAKNVNDFRETLLNMVLYDNGTCINPLFIITTIPTN